MKNTLAVALASALLGMSSIPCSPQQVPTAATTEQEEKAAGSDSKSSLPVSAPRLTPLVTTVEVNGRVEMIREGLPVAHHASQEDVLASPGTWGDFNRYLQILPGVVWTNDYTDEIRVRGGNPTENLYVVDGIEVPNINHLALEGTTGGFASMVDTNVIDSVEMNAGNYDLGFSRRLSSVVEVHTRNRLSVPPMRQFDFGITGGGAMLQRPLGSHGALLASAHRSVLNLATDDIGLNGTPIYTNGITQLEWRRGDTDRINAMNLSGADSIDMRPEPCDRAITTQVDTTYTGYRSTSGLVWQHASASKSSSALTISYSSQNQNINQIWIESPDAYLGTMSYHCTVPKKQFYLENTHDGIGTAEYKYITEKRGWTYSGGAMARLLGLNYLVEQPLGAPSMFNPNPTWTDANSFRRSPNTGQTAVFLEANGKMGTHWTLNGGVRQETFALAGTSFLNAQVALAFRASEHQAFHLSIARSGQLAPAINILSYPGNNRLAPIEAVQIAAGGDLFRGDRVDLSLEVYRKRYSHEPVSTEYPSLMLANMMDTLGQQFAWLPMRSSGTGTSNGLEVLFRVRSRRVRILSDLTYSRSYFSAADGISRPGNFDLPVVANQVITLELPWRFILSARNSFASGRPYTPFNIPLSVKQSRGIYDLSRINAVRGSAYDRLDLDLIRSFHIKGGQMEIHGGVENALDRNNFLGLAWMNSCHPKPTDKHCDVNSLFVPGIPETQISQMGLFPSAWINYRF